MMQESDESGDHRSGAPQKVLLDAVKPRWSLAHGGDDHIADFLPRHMPVLLTAALEDKAEMFNVDEGTSLHSGATNPISMHVLKWRQSLEVEREPFVALEGEFVLAL